MELKVPVIISGVKTVEELASRVLDDYEYKGMTVRQWADRIVNPKTRADNIRSMTDEELATWLNCMQANAYHRGMLEQPVTAYPNNNEAWLEWLKQEEEDGKHAQS